MRSLTRVLFRPIILAALALLVASSGAAAALQSPASADWGNWQRGDAGTLYVHWAQFDSFVPVGFPAALPDTSPDVARIGVIADNGAVLIPNNSGAFITGSGQGGNVYSFGDTNDFDVILRPAADHVAGPVTVALQVVTQGTPFDAAQVRLNGLAWSRRLTLDSQALGGDFGGDLLTELYLWEDYQRPSVAAPYAFDLVAEGTSNSLDRLLVDIGPAPFVFSEASIAPVPLPGAAWLMLSGAGLVFGTARGRRGDATRPR